MLIDEGMIIDRNDLDEECASVPAFFDYWITKESDLKTEKENYESRLDTSIRKMAENDLLKKYGITKLTEVAISSLIKNDARFQSIKQQHLHAESKRRSYEKKIAMLETLAKLHGQGYFSKVENKKEAWQLSVDYAKKKIKEEIEKHGTGKPERPKRNG